MEDSRLRSILDFLFLLEEKSIPHRMENESMTNIDPAYVLFRLSLWFCVASKRWISHRLIHGILTEYSSLFWNAYCLFFRMKGTTVRLRWLSEEEAVQATAERNSLLRQLSDKVSWSAKGCKPHIGPLSPGCRICQDGGWGCNFINRLCTRDCDFCKREHCFRKEPLPETLGWKFATPEQHVDYLRVFGITGVGFSGGEPLLVKEVLLQHIKAIRRGLGRSIYIWMYTNGDLVDDAVLVRLRDVGLDEIRFNVAARGYDLTPVALACRYIPTVTIEIPVIPEDFNLLKQLLPMIKSIGVNFLNIHQLAFVKQNHRLMNGRPYTLINSAGISVYESELAALRLLDYASQENLHLPINYCSSLYKLRFQPRAWRRQRALAVSADADSVTDVGYLRSVRLQGTEDYGADITFFEPRVLLRLSKLRLLRENLKALHLQRAKFSHLSMSALRCWRSIRAGKMDRDSAIAGYIDDARQAGYPEARIRREVLGLREIAWFETLDEGFSRL